MRKVKWEPKAVRKEKMEEKGQGYLELLMSSERVEERILHNGLREKL